MCILTSSCIPGLRLVTLTYLPWPPSGTSYMTFVWDIAHQKIYAACAIFVRRPNTTARAPVRCNTLATTLSSKRPMATREVAPHAHNHTVSTPLPNPRGCKVACTTCPCECPIAWQPAKRKVAPHTHNRCEHPIAWQPAKRKVAPHTHNRPL